MTNVNPQLSGKCIDCAKTLMIKDKNNVTIYVPILVSFEKLVNEATYLKIK